MKTAIITVCLLISLLGTPLVSAIPNNTSIIEINDLIQAEDGFFAYPAEWSPNGKYLLIRSYNPISMSESINKHYLIDVGNKTYGEIDYGITEEESNYVVFASSLGWFPSGDRIYFTISKNGHGRGTGGTNYAICNPDGTDVRVLGSPNIATLSGAINDLGGGEQHMELAFSPDSSRLSYEYEDSENSLGNLWIEDIDGTNFFELRGKSKNVVWYNSTTVYFITREGTLMVTDKEGNAIRTFSPENDNEKYNIFTLSPDRQKMTLLSSLGEEYTKTYPTYIANINGSNLLKTEIGTDLLNSSSPSPDMGNWQPNGSSILLEKNGDLYILEGKEHSKRLLYEGNATYPQWFPTGDKILFLENNNQIYSINADSTNISFIANIGLVNHHIWDIYEWKQISISPSGDRIAFTSALYPSGGKIDLEPSLKKAKNIAAPLFITNSDGTNLTRLTPSIKGKHYFLDGWNPDEKLMTVGFIRFSENGSDRSHYLFSLDGTNICDDWEKMPVSQIIGNDNPIQMSNSTQVDESTASSEIASNGTENKQIPSFRFFQFVFCLMGAWMLQKKQKEF